MNLTYLLVTTMSLVLSVYSVKEHPITVSDTGEGSECDADLEVAKTCLACSRLNQDIAVPLTVCCAEPKAYTVCQICTKDPTGCLEDARSISSEEFIEEDSSDEETEPETEMNKRYGRMFMGGWSYPGKPNKRYGRMFFSGYPGLFGGQVGKRFGRLFANGYGYPFKSYTSKIGKRFGRLFTSQSGQGKRYGSLFLGRNRW